MYSISGVPLDNDSLGWGVDARTKTLADLTRALSSVSAQGRDGAVSTGPGSVQAPVWALYVRTRVATRESLVALISGGSAVTVGSRSVGYTVAGVSVAEEIYAVGWCVVQFLLRLDGVYWRDSLSTAAAVALGAASVPVSGLFPSLSAPVQDAVVRVKGACTGLQVTDSAGSWFTYAGALTASQYLRFESDTGRGFVTGSDTWSGGTEVSGAIDFGGPRGLFEISPAWSSDPAVRAGVLTVATATRSGAQVQVRGRGAFVV